MPVSRSRRSSQPFRYYEFPYLRFHGRYYPLIPITLRRGPHSINTLALLDSGASISVFRPEISRALRLPLKPARSAHLGTPTGGVQIGLSDVEISVRGSRVRTRVGFSQKHAAAFNILGREGFFNRFSVCFNEIARTVVLVPLGAQKK